MNRFDQQWSNLTALARQAPASGEMAAPYGFATRVAAVGMRLPSGKPWEAFERFALRGLFVAGALGVTALVFNLVSVKSEPWDEYAGADIVASMLDISR